jgi:cell division protein FtsN
MNKHMYSISEKIQKQLIFGAIVIFTIVILTIFSIIINHQKKQKDPKKIIQKDTTKYVILN